MTRLLLESLAKPSAVERLLLSVVPLARQLVPGGRQALDPARGIGPDPPADSRERAAMEAQETHNRRELEAAEGGHARGMFILL